MGTGPGFQDDWAKLEAVDAKLVAVMAKIDATDTKVESFRRELLSEVHRVEAMIR